METGQNVTAFEEQVLDQQPIEQALPPTSPATTFQKLPTDVPGVPGEPQAPQKYLGLFDSEEQALAALGAMLQEKETLEGRLREIEQQSNMDVQQRRAAQLESEYKKAFYERQQNLSHKIADARQRGRHEEAAELTSQLVAEAAEYKMGRPDQMIEEKVNRALEQRLAPVMSLRQFNEAEGLQHLRPFAEDAVRLQQQGLPEKYIVDLLNRAYASGIQQYTEFEKRKRGYTEPVEIWGSPQQEKDFESKARNRWAELIGVNKQKDWL